MRTSLLPTSAGALLALLIASGCATSEPAGSGTNSPGLGDDDDTSAADDDDTSAADDDDTSATTQAPDLLGVVRGADGDPLQDVTVRLSSGEQTSTDPLGRYAFEELPAGDLRVNFALSGYANTQQPATIPEEGSTNISPLLVAVDFSTSFNADDGFELTIEAGGPSLSLPAAGYVDASGASYSGVVEVDATWYDLSTVDAFGDPLPTPEILSVPGDFTAIDASGEDQILESFGMIQVNLRSPEGDELQLADGAAAPLVMPLQGSGYTVGQEIPAWSYDEDSAKWIEEGLGVVVEMADGSLAWTFDVPHFSSWNCDAPISQHGCLTGNVVHGDGSPYQGARVRAVGIGYQTVTDGRTAADGSFCVEVKNGEQAYVIVDWSDGQNAVSQQTQVANIPAGQASCSLGVGTCTDLGQITLEFMTCIAGQVVDEQGSPVPNAQIFSPQGGATSADADGRFEYQHRVFQQVDTYVIAGLDEVGFQPTSIYTHPSSAAASSGQCPNRVRLEAYTVTGCAEGFVVDDSSGQQTGLSSFPVEAYDSRWPAAAIYSTVTAADGSFCAQLPAGQVSEISAGVSGGAQCTSLNVTPAAQSTVCNGSCDAAGTISCTF